MNSLDVLVLCSSPVGDLATLKLALELTKIEGQLRKAHVPVRMQRVFPPTLKQLQVELARMAQRGDRPAVFHFLGHGDDDGLYFEDEFGQKELVKGAALKRALQESPVQLVLLNACWSATKRGVSLAEFLTREQVAQTAIGHEVPVEDQSAIHFAEQFYEQIVSGQSAKIAWQRAANALAESGLSGAVDVKLVGNADLRLTDGLPSGQPTFVCEDGLPKIGRLPDAGVFFGRPEQLVEISRTLADPGRVALGVWGLGGIGKTALALAAARRNAWRYRGTAWVDIRDTVHKTTAELLRLALGRLQPGAPADDPADSLARFLQSTPALIVLDNLEDLPESERPALARFLGQLPRNGSHVLLTARVPLPEIEAVPDAASLKLTEGLDGWHGPHYVQHVARQKKCRALQDDLRRRHGTLDTIVTGLEGKCVLVSHRLHGHPKMLELAVGLAVLRGESWLDQSLASLPEHLEDQIAPLLATSFEAVGTEGRRLLPLLVSFPTGRLTREALQVVADVAWKAASPSATDEPNALDPSAAFERALEQLVQAGLLDYDQTTDTHTFHQSILDAAGRERLDPEVGGEAAVRLLVHYRDYFIANTGNYPAIDRCFDNAIFWMEQAWEQRTEASPVDGLLQGMVGFLGYYFEHRGHGRLGQTWHDRAIELHRAADDGTNEGFTAELARQASLAASRGYPDEARQLLTEALKRAEQTQHEQHVSALLHQLAILEEQQGNPGEARHLLQRSMQLTESLGDQRGLSASLYELAILESQQGNPGEARRLLQRSMQLQKSLGDQRGLAASLHVLASLESQQGNPGEARRLLQRSMQLKEALGDQRGLAASLHELAILESQQGNPGEARRLLQRSMQLQESLGDQRGLAASLHQLAILESQQGNPGEARRLLQRSMQLQEPLGDQRGLAASLHELAILESQQGNPGEARRLLQRSLQIEESLGDQRGLAASLHQLASLEEQQGNPGEARRLLQRSMQIDESLGDQRGLSASLHELASLESQQGNPGEARRLLQRSMQLKEALGDQRGLAASLHELANLEVRTGNREVARRLWERSIAINNEVGDIAGAAATMSQLAQLEAMEGNGERALEMARESVRKLESLGYAQAEQARGVLRDIEHFVAHGGNAVAAPPFLDELLARIQAWQALSASERESQLRRLASADAQAGVLTWLAHCVVCFQAGDHAGSEAAEAQAQAVAARAGSAELQALVAAIKRQRQEKLSPMNPELDQLLGAATQLVETGNPAQALPLLEQAVAHARQQGDPSSLGLAQFFLGQALMMLRRAPEAVTQLKSALELATQTDDRALIHAAQQVLTVAVQLTR